MQAMLNQYATIIKQPLPSHAAIAVAAPIFGDRVEKTLSNLPWSFSITETQKQLGFEQLKIVNDFTALAAAIPCLQKADSALIKPGHHCSQAPCAIIGPGTGLGTAGLVFTGNKWLPVASEGGNMTLSAHAPLQESVLALLKQKYGHVSAETILSGQGIVRLYEALSLIEGITSQDYTPEDIGQQALKRTDTTCLRAVQLFFSWLASMAADIALCFAATGGVFIGGGIPSRLISLLDKDDFISSFIDKGELKDYLERIPVYLITHPTPALLGAAAISQQTEHQ